MKVVVFHRKPRVSSTFDAALSSPNFCGLNPYNPWQAVATVRHALMEPFSERKFLLKQEGMVLSFSFDFKFYGKPLHQDFQVTLSSWTYLSFWYRSGLQRVDVINEDFNRQNAMVAGLQHELADLAGAVGRILILDDTALLYLRGNIPDVDGFENVTVAKGEHSTWAFARYCPKAGEFLDNVIQRRRDYEQTYSLPDKVAALEKRVEALESEIQRLREQ